MRQALISEHSSDAWECFIKQKSLLNTSYICQSDVLTRPHQRRITYASQAPPVLSSEAQR